MITRRIGTTALLIVAVAFSLFSGTGQQESAKQLYERAVLLEETKGDLEKAIEVYQRIAAEFPDERELAAQSLYRSGLCYEKLGLRDARKAFQNVIDAYPDQTATVTLAREKLAALAGGEAAAEKADTEFKITKIHTDERTTSGFLSPDGKKLALIDWGDAGGLWLRDISTGQEDRILSVPNQVVDCWWSPDSQWIAYLDYAFNINAISPKGGAPKTIVKADSEASKTEQYVYPMGWTPDSEKLIFQVVTKQSYEGLYMVSASGGAWKEVYRFPDPKKAKERDEWLTLSPDGKWIAFQSTRDGNQDIYVMPAKGGEPARMTDDPGNDSWPRWSYDGRWILFNSARTGEGEVCVIRVSPDGRPEGRPIQVTRGGADGGSWTQDGKIGYSTSTDLTHVFIANVDGSRETQLTGQYKTNYSARWSPDGKNIAFTAYYGEGVRTGVMTVPSNGGDAKFLARGMSPAWSPDGKRIAYCYERRSTARPAGKATILIIPAEGGEARELLNYDGYVNYLDWSPDGRHIAFSYSYDKANDGPNPIPDSPGSARDIYIVPVTGGEPVRLTRIDGKKLNFVSPRWSPDGKKIAFLWMDFSGAEETGIPTKPAGIYTIEVEGGTPKLVTDENPRWWFCWTPDGRNIIFFKAVSKAEEMELYKVTAEGGKAERLNIKGGGPDLSPDGKKIAFHRKTVSRVEFWLVENFLPDEK